MSVRRALSTFAFSLLLSGCVTTPPPLPAQPVDFGLIDVATRDITGLLVASDQTSASIPLRISPTQPSDDPLVAAVEAAARELGYSVVLSNGSATGNPIGLSLDTHEGEALLRVALGDTVASRLYQRDSGGEWWPLGPFASTRPAN